MGYLDVEDKRVRGHLKEVILSAIVKFAEKEREESSRFISIDGSSDNCAKKEIGRLSNFDDCSVSFFENNSDNIVDTLENEELIEAMKCLNESEIDILTRLYLKKQDEYDIAEDLNTTVDTIQFKKFQIIEKLKEKFKI